MQSLRKVHYGWWVLLLAFLALLSAQGVRLSYGAFITPWEEDLNTSRSILSFVALLSFIVYGISQPVVGRIIDRYGVRIVLAGSVLIVGVGTLFTFFVTSPWQLVLLYGLFSSVGFGGASGVAASVAVTNWFNEKRGFALGMITAGTAAGQLFLVPLSLLLIEWWGWKITVLALGTGLIVLVFPLLALFLRTFPSEKGMKPYGSEQVPEKDESDGQKPESPAVVAAVFMTRKFWFLILPYFICGFTTTGLMDTHLIPFAHDHGFSATVTSAAVSLLAGFNILGTVLSGYIADRWSNKNYLTLLYALRAVSILILMMTHDYVLLMVFAVLFGLVDFATVAPTSLLATKYFKHYSVGFMLGWLYLAHQLGSALGAYLPGVLFDWTGSYQLAFVIAIVTLLFAAVASFLLPEPKRTTWQTEQTEKA